MDTFDLRKTSPAFRGMLKLHPDRSSCIITLLIEVYITGDLYRLSSTCNFAI